MSISAVLVKELREKSGAGMMDCKKALVECNGNMEEASDYLRKKGLTKASKKSSRDASEGVIAISSKEKEVALVEFNCETDFVTKNKQFLDLAKRLADEALDFDSDDVEKFKLQKLSGSDTNITDAIIDGVTTIGENLQLRRIAGLKVENGVIVKYIHNAVPSVNDMGKIVVAVAIGTDNNGAEVMQFGKEVAMHIAASRPQSLDVEGLDNNVVEKEKKFLKEQALASGKPENVVEKMIEGRIRKFYEEIVLLEQISMIEGKTKIKDLLAQLSSKVGSEVKILDFIRFEVGEASANRSNEEAVAASSN